MDLADIARLWGVDAGTVRRYKYEGRLPEPDAAIGSGAGRRYGWKAETMRAAQRPRRGARTDLRQSSKPATSS